MQLNLPLNPRPRHTTLSAWRLISPQHGVSYDFPSVSTLTFGHTEKRSATKLYVEAGEFYHYVQTFAAAAAVITEKLAL